LEPDIQSHISEAITLGEITAGAIVRKTSTPSAVALSATVDDVQREARDSGHLRVLVKDEDGDLVYMVHVRDTLTLPGNTPIRDIARPLVKVAPEVPVYELLRDMREAGVQLAIVGEHPGAQHVLTIKDVIRRVLP
jgi:CBS domain containing-hemolysin-like protein